ncbi:hypothetical protein L218DRAFT_966582, partial [Marasmius fiardii PR-910]
MSSQPSTKLPVKPWLTHQEVALNPEILTMHAFSRLVFKSFDGRCGNLMCNSNILVTTPNMEFLYPPPLNECSVRM